MIRREKFVPDRFWPHDSETGRYGPVADKRTDPDRWHEFVNSDTAIVTQWDDGKHYGDDPGKLATSSVSMPSIVHGMIEALDVRPGLTVLEIGTGSGYTAGRLGELVTETGRVVSLEVDAALSKTARDNLDRADVRNVIVVNADGFKGWWDRAPYERVHVTCGIREIPYAWVEQCTPGAVMVVPWGTDFTPHDWLLRLVVDDDDTASGRFGNGVSFMKLRSQQLHIDTEAYTPDGWREHAREAESDIATADVREITGGSAAFAMGLRVPDVVMGAGDVDGVLTVWLYSTSDRSVAGAAFGEGTTSTVVQSGDRSLWDEVLAARTWWIDAGRPDPDRFGLTVSPKGQRAWLEEPGAWVREPFRRLSGAGRDSQLSG
ncbi:protein-L-isoaspartate O-methyltransferase family protein [Embleya sp. AB8]|uniref:protein-L-isoaspartate O-methyltransferase family protein n=1 Tax=Embleya sp. AB8 TaxID=3156304 RepID=UPI003C78DB88